MKETNRLPSQINTATSAMTAATWATLTADQQARYLVLHGLSGSLVVPDTAMAAADYAMLLPVEQAFFAAANGLPAGFTTAPAAMTASIWTTLTADQQARYLVLHGLSGSLAASASAMAAAAYELLSPADLAFFAAANGLPAGFTTAPGAMTAAIGGTLTDDQRALYLALNGAAGAAITPAAMDAATFGAFTDAQKALYLAVFGLAPGASLGPDATSAFTAHLSSDYAQPTAFVNAAGAISQSATEFDALSNDVQAAEVQVLGSDGVLLVGAGIFVLGGNGAVNEVPAPAGFGLLPSAMDGMTFGSFSASEKSLYLRLNGLAVDATLGTGAAAFRAYPAASFATPGSFIDSQNTPSTALVDFDALPSAVQKQVVQAEGTGGVLLVGTPGHQAAFSISGGALVRTPVPSGFALVPSAMDAATYGSFTAATQALYLADHGLASTATLGSGSAAFNASTTGMTATAWAALSASQKGNYLALHGLSDSLSLPAQSTTGPTLGMAAYAALSPAERTFFAQVNGLPAAINTAPEAMTKTAWGTLSGSGGQALYLSLHGLSSCLTRTGVSLQPNDASNTTQMTSTLYKQLSQIERSFYARVNGFPPEFATAPEQMTAAIWAAFGDDLNTATVYLPLNGLSTAVTLKQDILPGTYSGLTVAEKSFAATIGNQPAAFIVAPNAMTAAIWSTFSVATKTSYLSENNLRNKLKDPIASFNVQFSSLTATEQAFLIAVNALPATFATTPTAMTAAIWKSFAPAQQKDYLRINDTISARVMEIDGAIAGPITGDTRSLYSGLQSASKAFFAAIEGLPSGFTTTPSAMTATIWATLTAPQKDLYLQLNGLSNSLTTKAANTTTAAYQALTAGERTFFAAVNGLPTTFVNAPTAMTSAIWSGYTAGQKTLYLGLNNLSPNAAASLSSISLADYAALSPAERTFIAVANSFPSGFSTSPSAISSTTFNSFSDSQKVAYLRLNRLPIASSLEGTPPFAAYPASYFVKVVFTTMKELLEHKGQSYDESIDVTTLFADNTVDAATFGDLTLDGASSGDYISYGILDYIKAYGVNGSLLVGTPGQQVLFTDTSQTVDRHVTSVSVSRTPVVAAFGVAPASMTADLFNTLPADQQADYLFYNDITASSTIAGNFGVTVASDGSFTFVLPTTFPTAAVALPAAPYAPPTATATALFSNAAVSAEIQATSAITYQAVPYGPAITGADLLGSPINQAVADKLFAVQDGTDTVTLAVIRGLTGQNAVDYATVPASLAPSTFENWSSQEQLAYLRKNVSTNLNGVFTIGTGDSSIHVFVGTPTSSSVPPKIYIAETLSKTIIAGMPYADQVKLANIPGISSTLNPLGLTTNVDAVKALLLKAYQCVAASGDSHTTSSGKVFTGANSINKDDKNIFIGEMNLLAAQLLGLTAPQAPGGASGTGTDTASAVDAQKTLSGLQTGGSAVFSLDTITAQLNAIQDRFVRLAAFAFAAKNKAFIDKINPADNIAGQVKYTMADKDVSVVNGYNTFAQQEAVIAQSAFAMAHLTASGKSSTGQDLDLPTLICLFELYANASQQAIVKADTQEINQVNVLLQQYSLAQKSVNLSIAGTKANTPDSKATFAPADDPKSYLQTMFSGNASPASQSSPIETLYGVARIYISTDGRTNEYFQQIANNLSAAVTTINQQSQIKMNDVTSENKQADRYFDLANTALSKMSDVLQKIAGAN